MLLRFATYGEWGVREAFVAAQRLPAADVEAIFSGNALRPSATAGELAQHVRAGALTAAATPSNTENPMKRSQINLAVDNAQRVLREARRATPPMRTGARPTGATLGRLRARHAQRARLGGHRFWPEISGRSASRCSTCAMERRRAGEGTPYGEKIFVLQPASGCGTISLAQDRDIVSYHGGTLMIQLTMRRREQWTRRRRGHVYCDGVRRVQCRQVFEIPHGASLTITPKLYHRFWAKEGARVLVGEISTISVPKTDNRFGGDARRFVPIEEDEPARWPEHRLSSIARSPDDAQARRTRRDRHRCRSRNRRRDCACIRR